MTRERRNALCAHAIGSGPEARNARRQLERGARDSGDLAAMLRHRLRYFTDGAVIGSKAFVNEAFANARERFGPNRKDGARKLKGNGKPASGTLWSLRDLKRP